MEEEIWRGLQKDSCCSEGSQELGGLQRCGVEEPGAELSEHRGRVWLKTKNSMVTAAELQRSCGPLLSRRHLQAHLETENQESGLRSLNAVVSPVFRFLFI